MSGIAFEMINLIKSSASSFRFESCPDYGEIVIFLYGIQSVKLENLLDSWKDSNMVVEALR